MFKKHILKVVSLIVLTHSEMVMCGPFDKAEDKGNEMLDFMQGSFGTVIVALAVGFTALALIFGWCDKKTAFRVGGGGIVIGSCTQIAEWLVG